MKKLNRLLTILIIIILNLSNNIYADDREIDNIDDILLINSYDAENNWENSIKDGLQEVFKDKDNISLKVEYLDSRNNNNESYMIEFEKLLNTKYKNENFDLIIAIDDEAFNLIRDDLFNKDSIFYKKMMVFAGINSKVTLTEEEKKYITGFIDSRSKIEGLDLISNLHPDKKNITIALDNTDYSKSLKKTILENKYLLENDINLNFINGNTSEEILSKLKNNNYDILLLSGIYEEGNTNIYIKPGNLIRKIKRIKDVPIYTTREDYIDRGVIGGYVDVGEEYGDALGKMILKAFEEGSIENIPVINRLNGQYVVDYEKIYEYHIDPLNLPDEVVVINKEPFQLLLPVRQRISVAAMNLITFILVLYIIAVMIQHRKNEIKNKKLYQMAKEREQLKTDFIGNISHEFRTPLNIIVSALSLIEMKIKKGEEIETDYLLEKIARINENSNRLIRLINNLIDITKFDTGFYELKCKNENIVYVVEDVLFATIDYAKGKNIDLVFDTDEEEIITFIDKEKIERVILNILSNAIKFTNENGKIEVSIQKYNEFVNIKIKDNGIGIPKEKINQIFHRFYQVDSLLSRKNEGSGLGLCIVNEIIKMHDGKVTIESEENKGTTFDIKLKIIEENEEVPEELIDITGRDIKDVVKVEMADI